ncbi:MAG: S16 family serine protease, partial [Oscillospiraceae bacterium]
DLLGAIKYKGETLSLNDEVGVVNGLAWTSVGGEMLKVEAISMEGTGKLELTGSLGDVMKESAKAAYSYIRSKSNELSINSDFYKTKDVHLHFPEGAVPKDGPSAGIAITTALVSTLSGNPVRSNIAMTGEVTLTGRVLPIGGLKEKSMAAYKAGVKTVIIPDDNLSDLDEIDKVVKDKINFIPVSNVNEVLKIAIFKKQENCAAKNIALPKMENTNIDLWHTN